VPGAYAGFAVATLLNFAGSNARAKIFFEVPRHVRFGSFADIPLTPFETTLVTDKLPRTHAVQG
jgi:hypothetical protein